MTTNVRIAAQVPNDIETLHSRLGAVYHQPVSVRSFTNKRFTVNFRVPIQELRRIVPRAIELDQIPGTELGMLSMCACDFWVNRLGILPIPSVRNNDMLCRISARLRFGDRLQRAYYTLRSDSSSRLLGFLGKHFSHFRKQVSEFVRVDDDTEYSLECRAADPICRGKFQATMASIRKAKPSTTMFRDVDAAKEFIFDLDGSCGYSYEHRKLSFQKIAHSPWDMYFCHEYSFEFPLIKALCKTFRLAAEIDCVLFMEKTKQTWGASWLYKGTEKGDCESVG